MEDRKRRSAIFIASLMLICAAILLVLIASNLLVDIPDNAVRATVEQTSTYNNNSEAND